MVQGPNLQRNEIAGWCSLLTAASATMVLALSLAWRPTPWLVWNASESAPEPILRCEVLAISRFTPVLRSLGLPENGAIGLYVVHPLGKPMLNDLVIVIPPEPLATFLAEDSYLPHGVPMLKQVRALGGQTVCRIAFEITIVGILVGRALDRDIGAGYFQNGRAAMCLRSMKFS
jgi:type IV secretory pathway protease TraF